MYNFDQPGQRHSQQLMSGWGTEEVRLCVIFVSSCASSFVTSYYEVSMILEWLHGSTRPISAGEFAAEE
ncbi:hypothetical protein Y032_0161g3374 [Ancylostoma ceylanicum]|uniref:Uncharacterized protein n=1 Tax=Ancylostoma ceylanicum TaxID=53326 RepID=A0A016SXX3_9BILA|nr:hypothetical protein Y032_0161g3374 [Ancylostoma ceylanicum]